MNNVKEGGLIMSPTSQSIYEVIGFNEDNTKIDLKDQDGSIGLIDINKVKNYTIIRKKDYKLAI